MQVERGGQKNCGQLQTKIPKKTPEQRAKN